MSNQETNNSEIDVMQEEVNKELQNFYKSLLTQSKYTKEYELFEGNVTVVCESPSNEMTKSLVNILQERETHNTDYYICTYLKKVTVKTDENTILYEKSQQERMAILKGMLPKELNSMDMIIVNSIRKVVDHFAKLCLKLAEATGSINF